MERIISGKDNQDITSKLFDELNIHNKEGNINGAVFIYFRNNENPKDTYKCFTTMVIAKNWNKENFEKIMDRYKKEGHYLTHSSIGDTSDGFDLGSRDFIIDSDLTINLFGENGDTVNNYKLTPIIDGREMLNGFHYHRVLLKKCFLKSSVGKVLNSILPTKTKQKIKQYAKTLSERIRECDENPYYTTLTTFDNEDI